MERRLYQRICMDGRCQELGPYRKIPKSKPSGTWIRYRAEDRDWDIEDKWRSPVYMPRWASRITLEITDVRVERIQDVSIEDVLAEGIKEVRGQHSGEYWREETGGKFVDIWDSINAKRGYGWSVNPWVWAITFRQIDS